MKTPDLPTRSSAATALPVPNADEYRDLHAFFRDALASFPPSVRLDMADGVGEGSGKPERKRGGAPGEATAGADAGWHSYSYGGSGDGTGWDAQGREKRGRSTGGAMAQLITSLAMLEDQEAAEQRGWEGASPQGLALFEADLKRRLEATADYHDYMGQPYADTEEEPTTICAARNSSAAAAAAAQTDGGLGIRGGGGGGAGTAQSHPHRTVWVKDRSRAWWDRCNSPDFPEEEFRKAFRMGRATFDMICDELSSAVAKEDTLLRAAIPVRQRVAVCIWRLATGEPLREVSRRFGLGISTCHKLVLEVCAAIKSVLMTKCLQWPADAAAEEEIKARFEAATGIPGVLGAIYTTHIPIIAPKDRVAAYFNRRHTERNQRTSYSITIQGVVDPAGVFTDVSIGWPGSMSDDQVLENSVLYKRAAAGMLDGQFLVGGSGYPLMDWLLVPYSHPNLTWTQHAFNEKIGEVQGAARDAFARLKGRWKCLQKRAEVKLQDLPAVLGACCVLHNICEMRKDVMDPELHFRLADDEIVPENSLRSASSMQVRESIAHNLLHRGLGGAIFF